MYNSRSDRAGAIGLGWSSWATARLRACPDDLEYEGPDGQRAFVPRMGDGYGRIVGVDALVQPLEEGLALEWFEGRGRWEFDARDGRCASSADRAPRFGSITTTRGVSWR